MIYRIICKNSKFSFLIQFYCWYFPYIRKKLYLTSRKLWINFQKCTILLWTILVHIYIYIYIYIYILQNKQNTTAVPPTKPFTCIYVCVGIYLCVYRNLLKCFTSWTETIGNQFANIDSLISIYAFIFVVHWSVCMNKLHLHLSIEKCIC